jgi:hypothetical protein
MLAYITGSVNEDLLRRIEYLLEENRVLRHQIDRRILLTDRERRTLADKPIALGKLMADTVRSSNGSADWWPRSSMASGSGSGMGDRRSILNWRDSSSDLPVTTRRGATTGLPEPFSIWATTSATRRSATFYGGTTLGHRPSGGRTPLGPVTFANIRTRCGRPTFLPPRFGPAGDRRPTMCCSSSKCRDSGSFSGESARIRPCHG